MEAVIRTERRAGWRLITLHRPDKLNAFNGAMHEAFAAALQEAAGDPACRAVLLTGAGRGFCAGQDLGPAVLPTDAGPPDLAPVVAR